MCRPSGEGPWVNNATRIHTRRYQDRPSGRCARSLSVSRLIPRVWLSDFAGAVCHVAEHRRIRWYNPTLERFEWREAPQSDEEALSLLKGSPHTPACTRTYREWRTLGASIVAAFLRAGEAAREQGK